VTDPLTQVVLLLSPQAPYSKIVSGAGRWSVQRPESKHGFYCVVMDGGSRLAVDGHEPLELEEGHFVLIPAGVSFTMSSRQCSTAPLDGPSPVTMLAGEVRHGDPDGPPNARLLIGQFVFGSPDASLLLSLLPGIVHVRQEKRLTTIVQLVTQEAREQRAGCEVVLAKLLEVMFIEALRSTAGSAAPRGLARGLSDPRLAQALRRMHECPAYAWTVPRLAREAGLSRTVFFERFNQAMGTTPMDYLLSWRMALAKDILRRGEKDLGEVAEKVGYSSASSFSVAFNRLVGSPPSRYARALANDAASDEAVAQLPAAAVA
jgi:AraC-like DNA-binding protein